MKLKGTDFVELYINWLKSNIKLNEINDYIEITTPFLDRHNDHIQIYVKQEESKFILTDDGYTIGDLITCGCDISSERRQNVLGTIINGLGVKLQGEELYVEARAENFAQKKHSLIQAMISVNDMFMLAQHRVVSLFLEDVECLLNQYDIRYTPSVQFSGKSGFSHTFDFVIPSSKKQPERLIKTINNPTKEKAETILFSWSDIRETRKRESAMYIFMNDIDKQVRPEVITAFSEYDIKTVLWTQREKYISELVS